MLRHMAGLNAQEATAVSVAQGMTAFTRSTIIHQASIGPNFDTVRGLDNRPVQLPLTARQTPAAIGARDGLVRTGDMPDATGPVRKRDGLA